MIYYNKVLMRSQLKNAVKNVLFLNTTKMTALEFLFRNTLKINYQ